MDKDESCVVIVSIGLIFELGGRACGNILVHVGMLCYCSSFYFGSTSTVGEIGTIKRSALR